MNPLALGVALLLFAWGDSARRYDADVVFYGLLLSFIYCLGDASSLFFSNETASAATTTLTLTEEESIALTIASALSLIPLFASSPLAALIVYFSAMQILLLHNASYHLPLLLTFASACAFFSDTCFRFNAVLVALMLFGSFPTPSNAAVLALGFLLAYDVVINRLASARMLQALYVAALGAFLALSCLALVDAIANGSTSSTSNTIMLVLAFQLNLFRRSNERVTWIQVQQIVGVAAGSWAAQELLARPRQQRPIVCLLAALSSLVFITKPSQSLRELNLSYSWRLQYYLGDKAQQLLHKTTSSSSTPPSALVDLSQVSRLELSESLAQLAALQLSLARSEQQDFADGAHSNVDVARRKLAESTKLATMLRLCEDMQAHTQARITNVRLEVDVFSRHPVTCAPLASAARATLAQLSADADRLNEVIKTKLRPSLLLKNQDLILCLNKWGEEKGDNREEYETMLEVARKRMKPIKLSQPQQLQQQPSRNLVEEKEAVVAQSAATPLPPSAAPAAAPPSTLKKRFSFRRSNSNSAPITPPNSNEQSMRTESSAGGSSTTASGRRRSAISSLLSFGKKRTSTTATTSAATQE